MPSQPLKIVVVPGWEGLQAAVRGQTVYVAPQRTPEATRRLAELYADKAREAAAGRLRPL